MVPAHSHVVECIAFSNSEADAVIEPIVGERCDDGDGDGVNLNENVCYSE